MPKLSSKALIIIAFMIIIDPIPRYKNFVSFVSHLAKKCGINSLFSSLLKVGVPE